jgi:DNA segregation ATPase FtsK/SpoIIIE, S-DNA-T family
LADSCAFLLFIVELLIMRLNPFRRSRRFAGGNWLKPEIKRAIIGVLLLVFSLVVILSFFSAAGPSGQAILTGLRKLFGFIAYGLPAVLIWLGYYLILPWDDSLSRLRVVGAILMILGVLGLLHVAGVATEDAYQSALDGRGGGLLGFMLAFPLSKAFSPLVALLIFIATALAGLFLTFNLSPAEVIGWLRGLVPSRQDTTSAGAAGDDDYEAAEDSRPPLFQITRTRLRSALPDPRQLSLEAKQEQEQQERVRQQVRAANRRYQPPDLDLLHSSIGKPDSGNTNANKRIIQETLEKFGIGVTMGKVNTGPTVTQYTLRPDEGIKLSRITALQNDLALALAAHPLRIEAPIPGTNFVGVEIPNKDVSLVRLRGLLASKVFRRATSPLTIALGEDVAGRARVASLETMPHLLIAGATGSGKSIFINSLVLSLLYRNSPALVRIILIDPKRVELTLFNGIPHLLHPVIIEPEKTIHALKWAVREMDRRYRLLSESGARNLLSFNANNPDEALPMIVIIIDELADLMSTHARDVEGVIVRLSQMARATGMHLVLATQRPSVNVITGLIKANIPTRIAFNVASQVDSRTILDTAGAEKLLGSGDMLFLPGDQAKPIRLQGSYVSEEEVRPVVADVIEKNKVSEESAEDITAPIRELSLSSGESFQDNLFEDAKQVVIESGKASASLLQRRLRVGYARAARLLDMLQERGVIGPGEGNKPREILVKADKPFANGSERRIADSDLSDDSIRAPW